MRSFGLAGERRGDGDALPLAAGEFVRKAAQPLAGARDAHPFQQGHRAASRLAPAPPSCTTMTSAICLPTESTGSRLPPGSWKTTPMSRPEPRRRARAPERRCGRSLSRTAAAGRRPHAPASILPEPLSPITRKPAPRGQLEADILKRGTGRPRAAIGDAERRARRGAAAALKTRSSAPAAPRARPRPVRCTASTVTTSATPGTMERNGAPRRTVRPSAIMEPQVTRFGSPKPRKESAASISTAAATMTAASETSGVSAFGRISRKAISAGRMPMTRAAATKSRSRSDSTSARAMRAGCVHDADGDGEHDRRRARPGDADQRRAPAGSRAPSGTPR